MVQAEDLPEEMGDGFCSTGGYRTTGIADVINGGAAGSLAGWFDDIPGMEVAARQLALNLIRKGPSPFARFHCDHLVDDVLLALEEEAAPATDQ